jgi:hypothetical protein
MQLTEGEELTVSRTPQVTQVSAHFATRCGRNTTLKIRLLLVTY